MATLFYSTICNANQIIRLTVSNGTNSDETIILFNSNSTSGFDIYDSEKMFANSSSIPELYTYCASKDLVINCLPTVQANPSVVLGFVTAKAGTFTIQATEISNLDNVAIILEDKYLHTSQNLHDSPTLTFSSAIYRDTDRFVIHFYQTDTWTGTGSWNEISNWSTKAIPGTGDYITIASGTLSVNQNCTVSNLTLQPGTHLTIDSGDTFSVNGSTTIQTGATVVENGKLSVIGTTTVQQALTGAGTTTPNGRFWYVASPLTGATSSTFAAAGTNRLWYYNETVHTYSEITNNTTTLSKGTGYVARLGANQTVSFTGTLTSGTVSITPSRTGTLDTKRGYNLIGNPYLSYLDWNTAYTSTSNMLSTIWYRTVNASGTLLFDTYSALGVGTNNNGFGAVTGYIPPMQAFWVKVDGDGNTGALTFTNSMRSHQTGSLKENNALPVIRLAVSNGTNSDEIVAVFADSASNGYDKFDSPKMSNNNVHVPELYMQADSEKVAINGLRTFTGNDSIAVGFHAFEKGTFAVSLHEFSGLDGYTAVLFDNVTKKSTDLSTGDEYSFVADSSDNASRFTLVLKSGTETTSIKAVTAKGISVSPKNGAIVVTTAVVPATVTISDVLGRVISSSRIASSPASIDVPATGIYFVTVASGTTFKTVKVMIQK